MKERGSSISNLHVNGKRRTQSQLAMFCSATNSGFLFPSPCPADIQFDDNYGPTSPFYVIQPNNYNRVKRRLLALRIAEASGISYFPIIMSSGASVSSSHLSSKVSVNGSFTSLAGDGTQFQLNLIKPVCNLTPVTNHITTVSPSHQMTWARLNWFEIRADCWHSPEVSHVTLIVTANLCILVHLCRRP